MTKLVTLKRCYCEYVGGSTSVSFKVIQKQAVGSTFPPVYDSVQCTYALNHDCEYLNNRKCKVAEDYISENMFE